MKMNRMNGPRNMENRMADISGLSSSMKEQSCLASGTRSFCPIAAVSRFPYKYIRSGDADAIANRFFNAGKFWNRCWDLYADSLVSFLVWLASASYHPQLFLSFLHLERLASY